MSPRIDPPVRGEDGSIATTATRMEGNVFTRYRPSVSMRVLFPAPGGPAMPTRNVEGEGEGGGEEEGGGEGEEGGEGLALAATDEDGWPEGEDGNGGKVKGEVSASEDADAKEEGDDADSGARGRAALRALSSASASRRSSACLL